MSTTIADSDTGPESATPETPPRRPRCRYLRYLYQERCTAESVKSVDDGAEVELCEHHLAKAWMLLARRGVVPGPELDEATERQRMAERIVAEKVASGELVRLPSGGLIEAEQAWVHTRTGIRYCPGTTTAEPVEVAGSAGTCASCGDPVRTEANRAEAGR